MTFGAEAAPIVHQINSAVIAQISPTAITYPAGSPGFYPAMVVKGSTSEVTPATRIAMEFALPLFASAGEVENAILSVTKFGGERGLGELEYRLFGYSGTGALSLISGIGGQELAGPFFYDIDIGRPQNLTNLDVTGFIRSLVGTGATHVGFSFRDTNTAANYYTDGQYLVVQDSPSWGGDIPPKLTITQAPEPGALAYLLLASGCFLFNRKRQSVATA